MINDSNAESLMDLAEIIAALGEVWTPHTGQVPIGRDLFYNGMKNIFVVAGRNFGKTELAAYCSWRYANENPMTQNYIFEPYSKQAREILWASNRIQTFGPEDWVESVNNTEMRVTFKNGSFIKLEGSDNSAAMAGIKPKGLIIYDEFKDHRIESIRNFEPNRAAFDVPALFIGTPPEFHNHFVDYMELAKSTPEEWAYYHAPTHSNPHISERWLNAKKRELEKLNDVETWRREYMAEFVRGGIRAIFPQINSEAMRVSSFVAPLDIKKWILHISFDPASTSVFGVIFALFNPYSKKIITCDEIYETVPERMTAAKIWAATQEKMRKFKAMGVVHVEYSYDEAAAWFRNEVNELDAKSWLHPSRKSDFGVEGYIGLVRAAFNLKLVEVTDLTPKFRWELENYMKDDKGRPPKIHDHLINAFQYLLGTLGLDFKELLEPKPIPIEDQRRGYRMEDEIDFGDRELDNDYGGIDVD